MKQLPTSEAIRQSHLTLTQQLTLFRDAANQVNQRCHLRQPYFLRNSKIEFNIAAYRKFVQVVLSAPVSNGQRTEYLVALQEINQLLQGQCVGTKLYHEIGKRKFISREDFLDNLVLQEPPAKRKLLF